MKTVKLKKENLNKFLNNIKKVGELWGPVKKAETYKYAKVVNLKDMAKEPVRTLLPIKKLFLPPRFTMFNYDGTKYEEKSFVEKQKIVYGVPPCEIHSLLILDRVFSQSYKDPYYCKARESTIIIALSCIPCESCFCKSTGTQIIDEGFDLAMTDLDDFYLIWVGTNRGDDLILTSPDLFDENITQQDIQRFIKWREIKESKFGQTIDFRILPDIMDLNYNSTIWDKFAEKCLSCGACTMVCPTCNCYNIVDEINLEDFSVNRERHWDSCMFKEYSMVAGGHNFRESKSERLKLWYTHKLKSFTGAYGKPSCVGCGRCVTTCPVNINVITVVQALLTGMVDKKSLNTGKENEKPIPTRTCKNC